MTSHIRADGDSIGSTLGLGRALCKAGKKVVMTMDSAVPDIYQFLPDLKRLVKPSSVNGQFDVGLVLDTPTRERLGAAADLLKRCAVVVVMDHHRTCVPFGNINWVDEHISSVGEMVFRVLKALRVPMDDGVAQNLYTAIMTDTGRFTYDNTTPASLRIAAQLMEDGLDVGEVARHVYQSISREVFALRAMAMETLRFEVGGRVGIMTVTRAMFKKTRTQPINTQDFVDIPRSIKGVSVAVLLVEMMDKPGWVKVSIRSDRTLAADEVARVFGGGGHARAAGCEIEGTLGEARKQVLAVIRANWKDGKTSS